MFPAISACGEEKPMSSSMPSSSSPVGRLRWTSANGLKLEYIGAYRGDIGVYRSDIGVIWGSIGFRVWGLGF